MKIVPKFARGGGFESFFSIYTPIEYPTLRSSGRSSSSKKDKDSDDLTLKDLLNILKNVDGLPNEVALIALDLLATLYMLRLTGLEDTSELAIQYTQSLLKIARAKFNKEEYDNAYKKAIATESLNDIAISPNGLVYVQTEEGIKPISISEYVKNKDNVVPITNLDILLLRYNSPEYVNNNGLFNITNNGIGLNKVNLLIKASLTKLGSVESSNDEYYKKGAAVQGAEIIERAIASGPEGFYKISSLMSTTNRALVEAALEYIYTTLPDNAKNRLRLETSDGSHESALKLIFDLLLSGTETKSKTNLSFIGSEEKLSGDGKSKSSKEGSLGDVEFNTPMKWLAGLGVQNMFILNSGTNNATLVLSNTMPLTKANGDPVGSNSTLQDVSTGEYNGILDFTNVTIGGKTINSAAFSGVVLVDGKIASIDYPYTTDLNGNIIPDTSPEIARNKQVADKELKLRGINVNDPDSIKENYRIINEVYKSKGLSEPYNSNGEPLNNWMRFGVVNVYADNHILGMGELDDNPLLKEVTDDATINNLILITKDKDFTKKGILNSITGRYDHFYQGTMWIPVNTNYIAAGISTKTKGSDVGITEVNQLALQAQLNWKSGRQPH